MSVIERIDGSPGSTSRMPLDRDVEIEKDLPIVIFPHQALDPENRGEAHTARDWLHVVQARCGVNDHIPSSTSSPSILSRNLTSLPTWAAAGHRHTKGSTKARARKSNQGPR